MNKSLILQKFGSVSVKLSGHVVNVDKNKQTLFVCCVWIISSQIVSVGALDGAVEGVVVGELVGSWDGVVVGEYVGNCVGTVVGVVVGK